MAIDWTLYERKLKIDGTTARDRQINLMKDGVINNFASSPSYHSAYFNNSTSTTDIQVVDNDETYIKTILMKPDDDINVGDSIVFDSLTWLCTEVDKTNPVYPIGTVYKSTQVFNLYKNNTIYTYPIVIDSNVRLYSMGYSSDKYITTPDSAIVVYIKNDNITSLIERGEIYNLSGDDYKIVDINRVVMPGLLILKCEYCVEDAESHSYSIEILNGSNINIQQGTTLQLNLQMTDNGIPLPSLPTISYSSSDKTKASVSSSGLVTGIGLGSCVIGVSFNGVSDSININVIEVADNNYTYSLSSTSTPDTEIKVNQTKTYTAQKYNNGDPMIETFTFSVTGDVSAYQLTIVDGNNCSIKCLKSGYTITLNAMDNNDTIQVIKKDIVLKALF